MMIKKKKKKKKMKKKKKKKNNKKMKTSARFPLLAKTGFDFHSIYFSICPYFHEGA